MRGLIEGVLGLGTIFWTSKFFPAELVFFVAGSLAYRGYVWLGATRDGPIVGWTGRVLLVTLLAIILAPTDLSLGFAEVSIAMLFAVSLPFIFAVTRGWGFTARSASFPTRPTSCTGISTSSRCCSAGGSAGPVARGISCSPARP